MNVTVIERETQGRAERQRHGGAKTKRLNEEETEEREYDDVKRRDAEVGRLCVPVFTTDYPTLFSVDTIPPNI